MKKYALLVGVEEYEQGSGVTSLKYACRDALVIADKLQNDCGFDTVRRLVDCDGDGLPTENAILRELQNAAVCLQAEDLFFFFFAGHGIEQPVDGTMRSYLLPRNSDLNFHRGLLETAVLKKVLNNIPCRQRLIILDCCRNDPEAGRGDRDNIYSDNLARDLSLASTRDETEGRVTILMTSCQPGKRAWEHEPFKHGIFSYYLQKGLGGEAWKNGTLEASYLCNYVEDSLRDWSKKTDKQQIPAIQQLESLYPIILGQKETVVEKGVPLPESAPSPCCVECPLCGGMNEIINTFRCKGCGAANLCRNHQDEKAFICVQCVQAKTEKKLQAKVVPPKVDAPFSGKGHGAAITPTPRAKPLGQRHPGKVLRKNSLRVQKNQAPQRFGLDKKNRPLVVSSNDFLVVDENIVIDRGHLLMWQRNGSEERVECKGCGNYIKRLNKDRFGGFTDWRLPTVDELMTLIQKKRNADGLYLDVCFDSVKAQFWSADLVAGNDEEAWGVLFNTGCVELHAVTFGSYVRAVRESS